MLFRSEPVQQLAAEADKIFSGRRLDAVCAVSRRAESPKRRQSPTRPGRRQQTPARRSEDGLCYYHNKFGKKAHKCEAGCTWQGNDGAASGN